MYLDNVVHRLMTLVSEQEPTERIIVSKSSFQNSYFRDMWLQTASFEMPSELKVGLK